MATPAGPQTILPPEDLESLLDLSRFLERSSGPAALVGPDGQTVPLPEQAFRVLVDVVHAMRTGKAITVAPVGQLLTTKQAADFLGISRPTLVKLLESGKIPFHRPAAGRHRRVRLEDVLGYQQAMEAERSAVLDELTADEVQDGLYDASSEDYARR